MWLLTYGHSFKKDSLILSTRTEILGQCMKHKEPYLFHFFITFFLPTQNDNHSFPRGSKYEFQISLFSI